MNLNSLVVLYFFKRNYFHFLCGWLKGQNQNRIYSLFFCDHNHLFQKEQEIETVMTQVHSPPTKIIICNEKTVDDIKKWSKLLTVFLHEVSYLTEAYILDYFVENHWDKLAHSWQNITRNFCPEDLNRFIDSKEKISYQTPWPLSLLSFRACAFAVAIPRHSIKSTVPIERFLQQTFSSPNKSNKVEPSETTEWCAPEYEFWNESGQHKSIPDFCRRHVKRKKQHEIFRLAQLAEIVLKHFDLQHVIDVGSGQGHLSRLLALCHKFNVATVEAEGSHVTGATNFDKQAYSSLMKRKEKTDCSSNMEDLSKPNENFNQDFLPRHVEESLTLATSNEYLQNVSKKVWPEHSNEQRELKFGLIGLHTCGNLAVSMLKTFIECSQPQVLLSVACCHMKLNSENEERSYPLSSYIKSLPNSNLSYEARELACHALEMYSKRLKENSPSLKIHCYRATLEKCIIQHYPNMKHIGLRGVKHAELMPFHVYAEKALSKICISISKEFLLSRNIQSCLHSWEKVLVFYTLRLITAPAVESLLLLDRMLHLYENGYSSCLVPIFDPLISPRNHVLISAKS